VSGDGILANPHVGAKLLSPLRGDVLVAKPLPRAAGRQLPVPPNTFWEGYGPTESAYLESGSEHTGRMLGILEEAGADARGFARVLDFGCAAGRMLRWYPTVDGGERWGCDIKGTMIAWCQQHLSPPMDFLATTTLPHLPFDDGYFDLVYCGSVFTHIIDQPDAWFLELRRLIRRGGYGYVTVFDRHALGRVLDPGFEEEHPRLRWFVEQLRAFDGRTGAFGADYAYWSVDSGPTWDGMPVPQVCYDIDYLTDRWSRLAEIVSVTEDAYGYQTGVLIRRR